jgi:hypothetical protein
LKLIITTFLNFYEDKMPDRQGPESESKWPAWMRSERAERAFVNIVIVVNLACLIAGTSLCSGRKVNIDDSGDSSEPPAVAPAQSNDPFFIDASGTVTSTVVSGE